MSLFDRHPGPLLASKTAEGYYVMDANGDFVFRFTATDVNAVLIMAELNSQFRDGAA